MNDLEQMTHWRNKAVTDMEDLRRSMRCRKTNLAHNFSADGDCWDCGEWASTLFDNAYERLSALLDEQLLGDMADDEIERMVDSWALLGRMNP